MTFLNIFTAILAFVRQYGALARPIIDGELANLLANNTITQAQFDALELLLNVILGTPTQAKASGKPTAAEFRKLAGY